MSNWGRLLLDIFVQLGTDVVPIKYKKEILL